MGDFLSRVHEGRGHPFGGIDQQGRISLQHDSGEALWRSILDVPSEIIGEPTGLMICDGFHFSAGQCLTEETREAFGLSVSAFLVGMLLITVVLWRALRA